MNTDPQFEDELRARLEAEASSWHGQAPWAEQARYARRAPTGAGGLTGRARLFAAGAAIGAALLGGAVIAAAQGGVTVPFTEIRIGPVVSEQHENPAARSHEAQPDAAPAVPIVKSASSPGDTGAGDKSGSDKDKKPTPAGKGDDGKSGNDHRHPSPRPEPSPEPHDDGSGVLPHPSPTATSHD